MSWNGVERRKYRRVPIRLQLDGGGARPDGRLETINLSAGGFSCRIGRSIEPLTKLALRMVIPAFGPGDQGERPIECTAIVVRCEPERGGSGHRFAACFLDLTREERDHISRYVDWHEEVFSRSEETREDWDADENAA